MSCTTQYEGCEAARLYRLSRPPSPGNYKMVSTHVHGIHHRLCQEVHLPSRMILEKEPTDGALDQGRVNTTCVPRHPPAAWPTTPPLPIKYDSTDTATCSTTGVAVSWFTLTFHRYDTILSSTLSVGDSHACIHHNWPRCDYVRRVYAIRWRKSHPLLDAKTAIPVYQFHRIPNSKSQPRGAGPRHRLTRSRSGIDNILALGPAPQSRRPCYCHSRTSSARPRSAKTVLEVRRLTSNHSRPNATLLSTFQN